MNEKLRYPSQDSLKIEVKQFQWQGLSLCCFEISLSVATLVEQRKISSFLHDNFILRSFEIDLKH